jgi:hypothetical protein
MLVPNGDDGWIQMLHKCCLPVIILLALFARERDLRIVRRTMNLHKLPLVVWTHFDSDEEEINTQNSHMVISTQ